MDGPSRLRERVALLAPNKLTVVLPVSDVREALERLAALEVEVAKKTEAARG